MWTMKKQSVDAKLYNDGKRVGFDPVSKRAKAWFNANYGPLPPVWVDRKKADKLCAALLAKGFNMVGHDLTGANVRSLRAQRTWFPTVTISSEVGRSR
jgi:hypothetical protein